MIRRTRGDITREKRQFVKGKDRLVFKGDQVQTTLSKHLNRSTYLVSHEGER